MNKSTVTQRYWASDAGAVNTNVWADGQFLHVYHLAVGRFRFDSAPFGGNLDGSWGNWRYTSPGVDGPTGRFGAMHCMPLSVAVIREPLPLEEGSPRAAQARPVRAGLGPSRQLFRWPWPWGLSRMPGTQVFSR